MPCEKTPIIHIITTVAILQEINEMSWKWYYENISQQVQFMVAAKQIQCHQPTFLTSDV